VRGEETDRASRCDRGRHGESRIERVSTRTAEAGREEGAAQDRPERDGGRSPTRLRRNSNSSAPTQAPTTRGQSLGHGKGAFTPLACIVPPQHHNNTTTIQHKTSSLPRSRPTSTSRCEMIERRPPFSASFLSGCTNSSMTVARSFTYVSSVSSSSAHTCFCARTHARTHDD
jgi:hypothetical protein